MNNNNKHFKDRVQLLYANGLSGIAVNIFSATLLTFAFPREDIQLTKYYWLSGMLFILACRLFDMLKTNKRLAENISYPNYEQNLSRFILGAMATSIMWSIFSLCFFSSASNEELVVYTFVMGGLTVGSVLVLSPHKLTACFYTAVMVMPFSFMLLFLDDYYKNTLGFAGIAYSLAVLFIANKSSDFVTKMIELKDENISLVQHMERKIQKRTETIYQLSNVDGLTGLDNRKAFIKKLDLQLIECEKANHILALLFLDLDGFKKINDTLGHDIGDNLLKQVAERLNKNLPNDYNLCRWGGDEFLIAVVDQNEEQVVQYGRELINSIKEPYYYENRRHLLGATIGASFYPDDATDKFKLIELADTAMYFQKKAAPSNIKVFSQQMHFDLQREHLLKNYLLHAIQKDELTLLYQPIVKADTYEIFSFEALLRWKVNGEPIAVEELIEIAEQYGIICKLGAWIIKQACIAAADWQNVGKDIFVNVNVSVTQILDDDFMGYIEQALSESGLPSHLLHIEITETVFAVDKTILLEKIALLHDKNIEVAIDDFGTGFSSLSLMQDIAVNIVKIDKAFVDKLNDNGLAVIKAIVSIAKTFDYKSVAEGVECKEQALELHHLNIDYLQGYYFSKPLEEQVTKAFILDNLACLHPYNIKQ